MRSGTDTASAASTGTAIAERAAGGQAAADRTGGEPPAAERHPDAEAPLPVLDPVNGEYEKIHRVGEGTYGGHRPCLGLGRGGGGGTTGAPDDHRAGAASRSRARD
jgi:hypothetical protein